MRRGLQPPLHDMSVEKTVIDYFRGRNSEAPQFLPKLIAANKPKGSIKRTRTRPNRRVFLFARNEPTSSLLRTDLKFAAAANVRSVFDFSF
jgi:hypothetical protein